VNVERDEGGSAFPELDRNWDNDLGRYVYGSIGGMTLRDYFAAKAMQGMLGALAASSSGLHDDFRKSANAITEMSYFVADAMLKVRSA
jgi:hypothetical protein